MSVDTDLALALHDHLTAAIENAKGSLTRGLEYKEYQQACGMIVAWTQILDQLPLMLDEIQRK